MPKSDPPRKRRESDQGQFVARQAGPVAFDRRQPDPNYPKEAFGVGMVMSQESMSGPLPAPKLVASYNEVIPNGAERIMVMAEKEQDGRLEDNKSNRDFNKRAIKGHNFRGAYAQIAATILVLTMLWMGYQFAMDGKEELASTLFKVTIGSVVAVFLAGQAVKLISDKKEKLLAASSEE